ncbi:hypothetical protein ACSQ67_025169 [Phaseolus vulgaris]
MFMSTPSGIAMELFVSPPEGHITSFHRFSKLFTEQYIVNEHLRWCRTIRSMYANIKVSRRKTTSTTSEHNRLDCLARTRISLVHAFKNGVLVRSLR